MFTHSFFRSSLTVFQFFIPDGNITTYLSSCFCSSLGVTSFFLPFQENFLQFFLPPLFLIMDFPKITDFMSLWLGILYSLLLGGFFTDISLGSCHFLEENGRLLAVTRWETKGLKFSLGMVGLGSFAWYQERGKCIHKALYFWRAKHDLSTPHRISITAINHSKLLLCSIFGARPLFSPLI